jgi:hypothetical protein
MTIGNLLQAESTFNGSDFVVFLSGTWPAWKSLDCGEGGGRWPKLWPASCSSDGEKKLAVQERYNQNLFFLVLIGSLQGIAVRPLPCSYYEIR